MMDKRDSKVPNSEAVGFDNKGWQEILRRCEGLNDCQFPAGTEIEIGGTRQEATITMKEKGLHANMQSDAAAFEAWALALLFHCGAQRVRIGVDVGASAKGSDGKGRHYERFLYRLERFSKLFPDRVIADFPASAPRALAAEKKRLLNRPNSRKNPREAEFSERMLAASAALPTESDLEKALEVSARFSERFGLKKVMRQWPVGLFKDHVDSKPEHQIFTGGKSAIDLVGIRNDNTLVLFELKKADNRKAGAVSELLFYASVMRDAIGDARIFHFDDRPAPKNCAITPEDIRNCSSIRGVLLAPHFHPFISEPLMFRELNAAMKRCYAAEKPVHFETVMITKRPQAGCGDFDFGDGPSTN
jgi:hypothetical protein